MTVMYVFLFFFFNDTATTEIYTLSLHDALPICFRTRLRQALRGKHMLDFAGANTKRQGAKGAVRRSVAVAANKSRSEEHTSELQSQSNLVCRLLLEKKKDITRRKSV